MGHRETLIGIADRIAEEILAIQAAEAIHGREIGVYGAWNGDREGAEEWHLLVIPLQEILKVGLARADP